MLILLDAEALYARTDLLLGVWVRQSKSIKKLTSSGFETVLAAPVPVTNGSDGVRGGAFAGVDPRSDLKLRQASALSCASCSSSSFFSNA